MNRNVSSASCLKVRYGRGGLRWKTPLNCGVLKALNSAANPGDQLYHVFTVERELSTGQLKELPFGAPGRRWSIMALWQSIMLESGQPGNAGDIYAVYGGVFYRGR